VPITKIKLVVSDAGDWYLEFWVL